MKKLLTIALIGNPNSGKSSLFNALVQGNQEIGNYPGVTVEKKSGKVFYKDWTIVITDLPGIYNLTAQSEDEQITRDFILENPIDVIVQVADCTHLERHLFLTSQLMETNLDLILSLNMWDLAKKRNKIIDVEKLKNLLKIEAIPTIAKNKEGIEKILEIAIQIKEKKISSTGSYFPLPPFIEEEISRLSACIATSLPQVPQNILRFYGIRLLEEDPFFEKKCPDLLLQELQKIKKTLMDEQKRLPSMQIAMARYEEIKRICSLCSPNKDLFKPSHSDQIDRILLHRYWGLPIFLVVIYLTFQLTFTLASYPSHWLEMLFLFLSDKINQCSYPFFSLLLSKGIIGGVGSVLIFLPNIFFLFLGLALLESSGYMTRVAFLMDKTMHKIGLHGKSFLPMLLGFGCTVPAILATRILESKRDRLITILILPLVVCSAKLVVFGLLIPPFFAPRWRPFILFSLYLIGILLAIIIAKVLQKCFAKDEHPPFLLEMPPYRKPHVASLIKIASYKSWHYVKKAGSVILLFAIAFYLLSYFPKGATLDKTFEKRVEETKKLYPLLQKEKGIGSFTPWQWLTQKEKIFSSIDDQALQQEAAAFATQVSLYNQEKNEQTLRESYIGKIGSVIAFIFQPLGFDWRISTSLLGSFASKEIFISQMGILFSSGEDISLEEKLQNTYSPLIAFCVMLFMLISTPCIATFATTRKEISTKWALFQFLLLTIIAYLVSFVIYQGTHLIQKIFCLY